MDSRFPLRPRFAWLGRADSEAVPFALVEVLSLAMVALLAAAVRFYALTAVGFNSDEAVYAGQAAAMAQVPVLHDLFPIFRAHPLLFQFLLALLYAWHFSDVVGRSAAVAVGILTVLLTYAVARQLYGRFAGLAAALILALMPYHVVVSRQVLLDGPMTLFATLAL
ncbi:MAG: glycosyltransferase family 39 protein, partial [Deinococcales bacterium]